jgi:hypothetical protein
MHLRIHRDPAKIFTVQKYKIIQLHTVAVNSSGENIHDFLGNLVKK